MINTIENPEVIQYVRKILNQYVKKDHLRTTMMDHAAKMNERIAASEQMIMANTNKFNELLRLHESSIVNKIDEKTNHLFWKFAALCMGAGYIAWERIDKLDTKVNDLDKKIDILIMRSNK